MTHSLSFLHEEDESLDYDVDELFDEEVGTDIYDEGLSVDSEDKIF